MRPTGISGTPSLPTRSPYQRSDAKRPPVVNTSGGIAFQDAVSFDFATYSALVSYNLVIGNRSANNARASCAGM